MNDALMIITCMVFPFLLAWLIKSVVRLDDEKRRPLSCRVF